MSTTPLPRLLVLMGSGETSPTMVKTHREVLARLGPPPVPAVLLDTPYGFQANADDLSGRAIGYFADSVGQPIEVARFRSAEEVGSVTYEASLAQLRAARYVFAGPGSPSYALRQWRASLVPKVLAEKLTSGGCLTFASAAALTVGVVTVPVYEIYKVGDEPAWLDGLDLLAEAGLRAAVIPHYNNAEGGTHDTRYCYLGEERLRFLEEQLPADAFVLGIDEHTGLVLDLDARTATVVGLGAVTVRVDGRSSEVPAGETVAISSLAGGSATGATSPVVVHEHRLPADGSFAPYPLIGIATEREKAFTAALVDGELDAAVQAVLDLEAELESWVADTPQSDERDQARAVLRSMIVRLGALARTGSQDPRTVVGPYVEALLDERSTARDDKRWGDADRVRDRLVDLGVEVRDSPTGTEWDLGG